MLKDNHTFEIIKNVIKQHFDWSEIFLFGSRAKGNANTLSDYDILIVVDIDIPTKEKLSLRTRIRKELLSNGIRTDILIQSRAEIEIKTKLKGHFIRSILPDCIEL